MLFSKHNTYEYIKERADKLRLLTSLSALRLSVWLFDNYTSMFHID